MECHYLIIALASKALSTLGSGASSALNYLQKNAPHVIDTVASFNPSLRPFTQAGQQDVQNARNFIQSIPQKVADIQPLKMLPVPLPQQIKTPTIANIGNFAKETGQKILSDIPSIAAWGKGDGYTYQPKGKLSTTLFGNNPIQPIDTKYREAKQGLQEGGFGPWSAPIAAVGTFGEPILDYGGLGLGTGVKSFSKKELKK